MIASFAHNFIFIKTRKTAGTSIELALGRLCCEQDIITPPGPDESLRWQHGWRGAQNFADDPALTQEYADIMKRRASAELSAFQKKLRKSGQFHSHMPAQNIAAKLDAAFWSNAFKWTIERHPYERAVSMAYFRIWRQNIPADAFQAVLNKLIADRRVDDRKRYTINGRIAVDEVIKFEDLSVAFPKLLVSVGLQFDDELPRAKTGQRTDRRPARDILSQKQKDQIYRSCHATFEMLGYER